MGRRISMVFESKSIFTEPFDSAGAHALAKARRLVGARSAALDAALGGVALSPTLAHEVQAPESRAPLHSG